MKDEGEEERRRRRTESRMVAKLQKLTAQNTFLAQKAKKGTNLMLLRGRSTRRSRSTSKRMPRELRR